jgi:hypothetical protein
MKTEIVGVFKGDVDVLKRGNFYYLVPSEKAAELLFNADIKHEDLMNEAYVALKKTKTGYKAYAPFELWGHAPANW